MKSFPSARFSYPLQVILHQEMKFPGSSSALKFANEPENKIKSGRQRKNIDFAQRKKLTTNLDSENAETFFS